MTTIATHDAVGSFFKFRCHVLQKIMMRSELRCLAMHLLHLNNEGAMR